MALGLINLNSKEDLEKLTKEQLVNLFISVQKQKDELIEKIINANKKELLELQKELKLVKEAGTLFGRCMGTI